MLFLTKLSQNCQTHAEKTAIEFIHPDGIEKISYGQLERTVEQTMGYLQTLGVQAGDRVALQLPKCLPFIYLHLAIMRLAAITLPLNPGYPLRELSYFLNDSEASLFFADAQTKAKLSSLVAQLPALAQTIYLDTSSPAHFNSLLSDAKGESARSNDFSRSSPQETTEVVISCPAGTTSAAGTTSLNPDTTALMIYTSGTTGRPKGAQITHGNLTANLEGLHSAWGWTDSDVLLHVLPIFHVHGLVVALHGALHAAATAVLRPKFESQQTLETLVARRCTVFMAVPTIHKRLVSRPKAETYDLSHVRLLTSGSDRLPDDIFIKFKELFGHTLLERYGMTETGMNLSNPLHGERRVGSVGFPLPGVEARIVDPNTEERLPDGEVGEVQVRGPHVFKGYWRMPQKTADAFTKEGWLRTGDMGVREADGYFTLKGRAKDLIISGGLNIYPPEVELVLAEHPAVAASAVIGCPDDEWGECVTAVIIPKSGQLPSEREIIDYCRQCLATYKSPKAVFFIDSFPRNALGKVQKAKLRERFSRWPE